jgi:hypothetical protein
LKPLFHQTIVSFFLRFPQPRAKPAA